MKFTLGDKFIFYTLRFLTNTLGNLMFCNGGLILDLPAKPMPGDQVYGDSTIITTTLYQYISLMMPTRTQIQLQHRLELRFGFDLDYYSDPSFDSNSDLGSKSNSYDILEGRFMLMATSTNRLQDDHLSAKKQ